jgi:hypothetical protein
MTPHFVCRLYEPCPFDGVKRFFASRKLETPAGVLVLGVTLGFPGSLTEGGGPLVVLIIVISSRSLELV